MCASQPDEINFRIDATEVSCKTDSDGAATVDRVRAGMKPATALAALAQTFRVLGDPTRVSIAWALSREELRVGDLATLLGLSQSVVSHSLRALRQLRLVRYRREGRIVYYALDDAHIAHLLEEGMRHVEEEP